jgi:transcription antitermination protein NusB
MDEDAAFGDPTPEEDADAAAKAEATAQNAALHASAMDEDSALGGAVIEVGSMRPRTRARYFAFVALYQFSTTFEPVEQLLRIQWASEEGQTADAPMRVFATQLATQALKQLDTIDRLIEQYARKRALHRIAKVDLALLRVGSAELLYISDVPAAVAINEMVELAKHFGADESPRFINAVLDAIKGHRADVAASEKVASEWTSTSA